MNGDTQRIRDFLNPAHCQAIRDPVWGHIWLPADFVPLLATPPFLKLQGIRQLGPAALVYPGATHSRYGHSLGVFHVAARFLQRLMDDPSGGAAFSLPGAKAFLAAALTHDLGHFPYTHSLKELPLKDHETLTAEIVREAEAAAALAAAGIDPGAVARIVDHGLDCVDPEERLYRSVLSGVLDPDKLDYLNRDAYYCGVPYGTQDLDFILSRIFVEGRERIGIAASGVSAIEHVLFSKYLMYKAVYWHKGVRTATAMIKRALWIALSEGAIAPGDLYRLDDARFASLAGDLRAACPALGLVDSVQSRRFHETLVEMPFAADPRLAALADLAVRDRVEAEIARLLGGGLEAWRVVIDIPEAVSFESTMPVLADGGIVSYLDSPTVFNAATVGAFTDSLRLLRVLVPADLPPPGKALRAAVEDLVRSGGRR